jgi:hypothetical protein
LSVCTVCTPQLDECKYLLLKIVEQAVRDYLSLSKCSTLYDRSTYETACSFLFDNDYKIDYGGEERSLRDILDFLDIDIDWFRERVMKLKEEQIRTFRIRRSVIHDPIKKRKYRRTKVK